MLRILSFGAGVQSSTLALMPIVRRSDWSKGVKVPGQDWSRYGKTGEVSPHWRLEGIKNQGGSWFRHAHNTTSGKGRNPDGRHTPHMTNPAEHYHNEGVKIGGTWFSEARPGAMRNFHSKSNKRKAASARIAKIPLTLARHIARCWKPQETAVA